MKTGCIEKTMVVLVILLQHLGYLGGRFFRDAWEMKDSTVV